MSSGAAEADVPVPERYPLAGQGRLDAESEFRASWIWACRDTLIPWTSTQPPPLASDLQLALTWIEGPETARSTVEAHVDPSVLMRRLTHAANADWRLRVDSEGLAGLQARLAGNGSLPPQTPAESVTDGTWLGHGFYWKSRGDAVWVENCVGATDCDSLESGFVRLKKARVLYADYELLRKDFKVPSTSSDSEIDAWLLRNVAFLSEGQAARIIDGDLSSLLQCHSNVGEVLEIQESSNKMGIRLRGGGRVAVFFENDEFWVKDTFIQANMFDVKGVGTSIRQRDVDLKANGFLSIVDAFKEFAYQRLFQRIAEKDQIEQWGTVQCYAIIDTGIRFKSDCANPATGYFGDRCVLSIRQRHSRLQANHDDVVYYSVASPEMIFESSILKHIRETLFFNGVSSEQEPTSLFMMLNSKPDDYDQEKIVIEKYERIGDWNIQATAPATHLVDFSHFYTLPGSNLPPEWQMSIDAMLDGFKLGLRYYKSLNDPNLFKKLNQIDKSWSDSLSPLEISRLEAKYGMLGRVGLRKPHHSWSWFLETDDSKVMSWAMSFGEMTDQSLHDRSQVLALVHTLFSWLP